MAILNTTLEELDDMEDFSAGYEEYYSEENMEKRRLQAIEDEEIEERQYKKSREGDIETNPKFEITPSNLRSHFLKRSAPLLDDFISSALGKKPLQTGNAYAQTQVWEMLKTIILEAKNPAPLVDLKGKTIDEQVDKILTMSSTGKITLEEAKDFLSLVQQGFELTELPELISKMEAIEALGYDK